MQVGKKIKQLRKLQNISQEDMANHLAMSVNGYARLERGEGRFHMQRLEKIAELLNIEITELLSNTTNLICVISENGTSFVETKESTFTENTFNNHNDEYIKEIISSKNEIIEQQKQQIEILKEMIEMLKKQA